MTTSKHKDCNAQESVFVDSYLITLDPQVSAREAKYSVSMSKTKAYQWVSDSKAKPHVFNAIQKAMNKRSEKAGVDGLRVLEEIGHSAFVDPSRYFDENGNLLQIHAMDEDVRRSISGVKVRRERGDIDDDGKQQWDTITEIKVNDKTRNLELYGKHLKLFTEVIEIEDVTKERSDDDINARIAEIENRISRTA